jgi:hypothetical protein
MEEIHIGATAHCTDGKAGSVVALVVDPVQRSLTHIVVRQRHHLDAFEWLVPVGMVQSATHDDINLGCTIKELQAMESFVKTRYVDRPHPDYAELQSGEYMSPYATESSGGSVAEQYEAVPAGELAVHRGVKVFATDGAIGEVGEFVIDPASGHITHVVLQQGHMWRKREIAVPVDQIDRGDGESVKLKLNKAAVEALPELKIERHYDK